MAKYIIITSYDPPPIPVRNHDWSCLSDNYEPGQPIGYGKTEYDAITDYFDQTLE